MHQLNAILKWLGGLIVAILAPFVLITVGALIIGAGVVWEMEWVTQGGIVLAALGVIWIVKGVFGD